MIVTWVVSYDAEALEPMMIAHRAGGGARLVRVLHGADGPEHGQMVVLLQHLGRIAEAAPAELELPAELVAHVAELFAWAGASRAELVREGIAVDPEPESELEEAAAERAGALERDAIGPPEGGPAAVDSAG